MEFARMFLTFKPTAVKVKTPSVTSLVGVWPEVKSCTVELRTTDPLTFLQVVHTVLCPLPPDGHRQLIQLVPEERASDAHTGATQFL